MEIRWIDMIHQGVPVPEGVEAKRFGGQKPRIGIKQEPADVLHEAPLESSGGVFRDGQKGKKKKSLKKIFAAECSQVQNQIGGSRAPPPELLWRPRPSSSGAARAGPSHT